MMERAALSAGVRPAIRATALPMALIGVGALDRRRAALLGTRATSPACRRHGP